MDLKLPALGEGADSGTVVNLFVKEGDQIAKDQPILELENEKAVATIPSTAAGTIAKVYVKPGDKLTVGQRILSVSGNGGPAPAKTEAPEPKAKAQAASESHAEPETETPEPEAEAAPDVEVAASPSIRTLARELGNDLDRFRCSARGGRITVADARD